MIPAPFRYERATSVDQAIGIAADAGADATFLAGGHSLVPLMKLRLAQPSVLVDLGHVRELSYIEEHDGYVSVGAMTRHRDVETSDVLRRRVPLLAHAASHVGDRAVRHRGTIGGSVCHADPAADLPVALVALGAQMVLHGPSGRRVVPAAEFSTGFLQTSRATGELLIEVRVPSHEQAPWSYQRFSRRAIDWAIVGVAAVGGDRPGVALANMGPTPVRAAAVIDAVRDGCRPSEAARQVAFDCRPQADLNASVEYRQHLATTLVRRALEEIGLGGASLSP